jgi:hypothetical protein
MASKFKVGDKVVIVCNKFPLENRRNEFIGKKAKIVKNYNLNMLSPLNVIKGYILDITDSFFYIDEELRPQDKNIKCRLKQ